MQQYLDEPLFRNEYRAGAKVPALAKAVRVYKDSVETVPPECEALRFYLAQDLFGRARIKFGLDEQLPEDWAQMLDISLEQMNQVAMRMASYLIVICTREARHMKVAPIDVDGKLAQFLQGIRGLNSTEAVNRLLNNPPNVAGVAYARALTTQFKKNSWSGGYGGKAWADVAQVYEQMMDGTMSFESMTDQGFSLAHNNGPIFNKGFVYAMYTKPELYKILDCQRAGQIPQLVASGDSPFASQMPGDIGWLMEAAQRWLPEYSQPVDWQQVMDSDPVGVYSHLLAKPAPGQADVPEQWKPVKVTVGSQNFTQKHGGAGWVVLKPGEQVAVTERA